MISSKPDFIVLTETWLNDQIPSDLFQISGYTVFRDDRKDARRGGGACILAKQFIHGHRVQIRVIEGDFEMPILNIITLEIKIASTKLRLACVYRPEYITMAENNNLIESFKRFFSLDVPSFMLGDFNYPEIDWSVLTLKKFSQDAYDFLSAYKEANVAQIVTFPTRVRGQQTSLIDLVLTNDRKLVSELWEEPPFGRSDHNTVAVKIQLRITKGFTHKVEKRSYHAAEYSQINRYISQHSNLDTISGDQDATPVCTIYDHLQQVVHEAIDRLIPLKIIKRNPTKPWLNQTIFKLIREKRRRWDVYRRARDVADYASYRIVNNRLKVVICDARKKYESGLLSSPDKKFYAYIRCSLNSKITHIQLKHRNTNELITEDSIAAEVFAEQFDSVFTVEDQTNIPSLPITSRCQDSITTVNFTPDDVREAILALREGSCPGPDDIPAVFLRKCFESLCEPLAAAMNESMQKGVLPEEWTQAYIIPIYKKGSRYIAENYRPISLTCNPCKCMEKVITKNLTEFLLSNGIIPASQHGFLPGRSTTTALLSCLQDWTGMHDEGQPIDVIYLDYEKAFDKVPHRRLLRKLEHYGVRGQLLRWIEAFVTKRQYRVRINGAFSQSHAIFSGVPQGSVLGPLLFILYISDLARDIKTHISFYADDTKLYCNPTRETEEIERDLRVIEQWASAWQMSLNVDKCTVMHIGSSNPKNVYYLYYNQLKEVEHQKDLGVITTNDLKWEVHISQLVKKVNSLLYLVKKSFADQSVSMISKIYKTYIRPRIEYANSVWSPYFIKDIEYLERLQRRITRIPPELAGVSYEDRLQRMQLTTLQERRQRGDLIETFKILNGYYNHPLDVFTIHQGVRGRGHSKKLEKEKCSRLVRKNFITNRVVYRWNALSEDTVSAPSVNTFKNRVDRDLKALAINFVHYSA